MTDGESLKSCQEFPDESSCWPLETGRSWEGGSERAERFQRTSSCLPLSTYRGCDVPGADAELEVDLYFVTRLEPAEDRRRWLDAEVRHLDRDHPCGFDRAVGQPRCDDVHLDLVLLPRDSQRPDCAEREAVLGFARRRLEGGEDVADLRGFVRFQCLVDVVIHPAVTALDRLHRHLHVDLLERLGRSNGHLCGSRGIQLDGRVEGCGLAAPAVEVRGAFDPQLALRRYGHAGGFLSAGGRCSECEECNTRE